MSAEPGRLVVVGTPIGNMGDLSPRAAEALMGADAVCAEDTRVTGKLLARFNIQASLERCDENVIAKRAPSLVARMQAGEVIAFCSDAGMPGISDPGSTLVDACIEAGVAVEVVPGPSAVTTAVAASGFAGSAFYFGGFLPRKEAAAKSLLASLAALDAMLVFYESPHRTAASLAAIAEAFPLRRVCMARELTKMHEEVARDIAPALAADIAARGDLKGEVVIVVEPPVAGEGEASEVDVASRAEELLQGGMSRSAAAKQLAREFGIAKNAAYDLLHGKVGTPGLSHH